METIGNYLKFLREQKEFSTVDVHNKSGGRISQSYVIQVEQGSRTPSVAKLEAFADVYGVGIHDLIDRMISTPSKKNKAASLVLSDKEIILIEQIRKLSPKKRKALYDFVIE